MFSEQFHKSVFFWALVLLAISLPYSVFTLSVAQITLMVNWLLEGKFKQKYTLVRQHPSLWILTGFYFVHLLWMFNTSDYSWGIHDLKIKLPMLLLPLVIATSDPLNRRKLMGLLNLFVIAMIIASFISAYHIAGLKGNLVAAQEDFFPYVSHIRLSLMIVLSIFIMGWLLLNTQSIWKWLYLPLSIWLIVALLFIQELTGILIFIIVSAILLIWGAYRSRNFLLKWFLVVGFSAIVLLTVSYITHAYAKFHKLDNVDISSLEKFTAQGNPYFHDLNSKFIENGHYVNLYVCETELRKTWGSRSKLDYDYNTSKGGSIRACLLRYLTSKGLRKDSAGIDNLTDLEIKYIETGVTNYIDTVKYSFYPKVYVAMWELYNYKNGANPTGYSISQRIEFIKTAFHIIKKNVWFGVGTGDIPDAYAEQYVLDKSPLAKDNRLRTHNQLITFIVTFGIIGFLLILSSLVLPPFLERKYSNYLFIVILIIGFLSFLTEDTLETHQGVSFFAFFYSLFLFHKDDKA